MSDRNQHRRSAATPNRGTFVATQEEAYGAMVFASTGQKLRLTEAHLERIRRHAEATYPEECCGILLGRREGQLCRVEALHVAQNEREDEARHHRFLIPAESILEAQKNARSRDLEIVGYYHSHPDCPPKPSEHDREAAWPEQSYLIVSVVGGEAREQRSWLLTDDRAGYREEEIELVSETSCD